MFLHPPAVRAGEGTWQQMVLLAVHDPALVQGLGTGLGQELGPGLGPGLGQGKGPGLGPGLGQGLTGTRPITTAGLPSTMLLTWDVWRSQCCS